MQYTQGLSPRVRGNLSSDGPVIIRLRSIPACAGEPGEHQLYMSGRRVYPRVCGGTLFALCKQRLHSGLSPRVRGNHLNLLRTVESQRSIPACAGEPIFAGYELCHCGVYPRVCGGTTLRQYRNVSCGGLSPRVRGNLRVRPVFVENRRSIPACAGEPCSRSSACTTQRVYPRVCGGTLP